MNQTSSVAHTISGDVTAVDGLAREIVDFSKQVHNTSDEFSNVTDKLNGLVGQFKV